MNQNISVTELYNLLRKRRLTDAFRVSGPNIGEAAEQLLGISFVKKFDLSLRKLKRSKKYKKDKQEIHSRWKVHEQEFGALLPEIFHQDNNHFKNLNIFLRLCLRNERKIVPSIHRMFDLKDVTYDFLLKLHVHWKNSKLEEEFFPSFFVNVCRVICGSAESFTQVPIIKMKVDPKGERFVRKDFFNSLHKKTNRNWENACDVCPEGRQLQDGCSFNWPPGLIYLNPPFSSYWRFYNHLKKQIPLGKVTEILFVMPLYKWKGVRGKDPCLWIKEFQVKFDGRYDEFEMRYSFSLPNGSQVDGTYNVMCVHLIL